MSYIITRSDKDTERFAFYEDGETAAGWHFFAGGDNDLHWVYSDTVNSKNVWVSLPRQFRSKSEAQWYLDRYIEKQTKRGKENIYLEPYTFKVMEYLR